MGAIEGTSFTSTQTDSLPGIDLAELARLLHLPPAQHTSAWRERYALLRLTTGDTLCRAGDPVRSVYAVRSGFFKTSLTRGGAEQVLAFPMTGDLIGIDGIADGRHVADSVALADSEVAIIPRNALEAGSGDSHPLGGELWRHVGRELEQRTELIALLGSCGAEARVAGFLLSLSGRYAARGYSPRWFQLRMTRADIGNLLGLSHETVTRVLTRLQSTGVIRVRLRELELLAPDTLRGLAEGSDPAELTARGRRRVRGTGTQSALRCARLPARTSVTRSSPERRLGVS